MLKNRLDEISYFLKNYVLDLNIKLTFTHLVFKSNLPIAKIKKGIILKL